MLTPLDIENKKFSKQMMNGYSVEEVDDFLDELTEDYEKLYKEVADNKDKLEEFIKNTEINRIILDSYHTYIPEGKVPIIVLNIDVDPILIDVNVHPTKMDIKFSKMDTLKELISNTPITSILSPIKYSSAYFPMLNPIALIIAFPSFNVNFKCFPSDKALIESIFKFL